MKRKHLPQIGTTQIGILKNGSDGIVASKDVIREKVFMLAFADLDPRKRDAVMKEMIKDIESPIVLHAIAKVNYAIHHILLGNPNIDNETRAFILKNSEHSREIWEYAKNVSVGSKDFEILISNSNSAVRELMVKRILNEVEESSKIIDTFVRDSSKSIRILVSEKSTSGKILSLLLKDEDEEVSMKAALNINTPLKSIIKRLKTSNNPYLIKVVSSRIDMPKSVLERIAERLLDEVPNSENIEIAQYLLQNPALGKQSIRMKLHEYSGKSSPEYPPF